MGRLGAARLLAAVAVAVGSGGDVSAGFPGSVTHSFPADVVRITTVDGDGEAGAGAVVNVSRALEQEAERRSQFGVASMAARRAQTTTTSYPALWPLPGEGNWALRPYVFDDRRKYNPFGRVTHEYYYCPVSPHARDGATYFNWM